MAYPLAGWIEPLLSEYVLLASADVDEARLRVSQVLNDHVLAVRRGSSLTVRLRGVESDTLGLYMLEYGKALSVETQPARDFLLVQMALSGEVGVECSEGKWTVRPGNGVVLPSDLPLRLSWNECASQVILKIPLGRLRATYRDLTGRHLEQSLIFNREIALDSVDGVHWSSLLHYFCEQAAQRSSLGLLKTKVAEENLLRHLLCAQSASLQEQLCAGVPPLAPKHVRRAREFMDEHLRDDMSLEDIARYCGVSARSLSRAFQAQYGVSPMQMLRALRLDRIRQELRSPTADVGVSEIAMRWGCSHLGRFAATYRWRFGEAPHETLKASRFFPSSK